MVRSSAGSDIVQSARNARTLFEEALHIDSNFVPALVAVAASIDQELTNDLELDDARFEQARDELDRVTNRAVRIDANDASAWAIRAISLVWHGRPEEGLAANAKAQILDPSDANVVNDGAFVALAADRPDEALSLAEKAVKLERGAMHEEASTIRMACMANLMLGRYSAAVPACERSAALQDWWVDHAWLVAGYAQQGDMTKASIAKATLYKLQANFTIRKFTRSDAAATSPAYLRRAETHLYSGLRKAGVSDR
jgi:Tfp pilus assembly protein PilF